MQDSTAPVPVPRTSISNAPRPKSENPGSATSTTFESKRPMSIAVDSGIPEEVDASTAPAPVPVPRRIPGVFAGQHGAIGALAAAVTGKRTSGSHLEMIPTSPITQQEVSLAPTEEEQKESLPSSERSEKPHVAAPPTHQAPIVSQVPLVNNTILSLLFF